MKSNQDSNHFTRDFAFSMLPKGKLFTLPLVIFLLWICLSMLAQLTFVSGADHPGSTQSVIEKKKSVASTGLVYNNSSQNSRAVLEQKRVSILGSLK